MTEELRHLPLLLHQTASAWRNLLDKRLKPLGLSQAKWRALLHLSLADRPLTQTELAQRLGIEGPSVARLLDRLAKEEWVERVGEKQDRRVKTVHLTPKARDTIARIHATANQLRDELLMTIPLTSLQTCMDVLKQIKDQADKKNASLQ